MRLRDHKSSKSKKSLILDEFYEVCGISRKHAIKLLNNDLREHPPKPGRKRVSINLGSGFDSTWTFSNSSNYEFDENLVEVVGGKAKLKVLDLEHSGDDFNSGNHVGSHLNEGLLEMKGTSPGSYNFFKYLSW